MSWTYLDDLARAFAAAARVPRSAVDGEIFIVVEENAPTWGEARNAFHKAAHGQVRRAPSSTMIWEFHDPHSPMQQKLTS